MFNVEKKMKIVEFIQEYVKEAEALALVNYQEEREHVIALPQIEQVPDVSLFANNGLGVAALEDNGQLIGFLGCYEPWEHAFDSHARGTFSPIHSHAARKENRAEIYKRMYQYAAEKWIKRGITYHAIGLYAHDKEAIGALFQYGFGSRCVDAIRDMNELKTEKRYEKTKISVEFRELQKEEVAVVRDLRRRLSEHMGKSPCFMYSSEDEFQAWLTRAENRDSRLFVASEGNHPLAFMEIQDSGENFATEVSDMKNICGAFGLPEYRGMDIYQELLNYVIMTLKKEGIQRLGVDFESFNPTAYGFWTKHFEAYTNSVVRRIDECALYE